MKLDPNISYHTLRHCFTTHALEDKVKLPLIQHMLGHKDL
ncbi:tyrosine-type recombinase/integrase [Bacillus sp. T3]